nr:helix-turn-helix transcriptional regulator [Actinoplanes lichenicola]
MQPPSRASKGVLTEPPCAAQPAIPWDHGYPRHGTLAPAHRGSGRRHRLRRRRVRHLRPVAGRTRDRCGRAGRVRLRHRGHDAGLGLPVGAAGMNHRSEIRDFLTTRRARITPERAGLPSYGTTRRVPGLRREEAAMLAGVSVDYYTRLERGNLAGVSESVLESLARAFQLDDAEREHLYDLARQANKSPRPARRRTTPAVRPVVQQLLDAMTGAPAYVRNGRLDILAANQLGRAVFAPLFEGPPNLARFIYLDPASQEFYRDWEQLAEDVVALLRGEAGRNPYDRGLTDLIGELSTRSEIFRTSWAAHNVRLHRSGVKRLRHPLVGDLSLAYESMELTADQNLRLNAYSAAPGSADQDALNLIASWAATTAKERA